MKIVVNRCADEFSLSARAVARLAELNGQKAYFFADGEEITLEETRYLYWYAFNTNQPTQYPPAKIWSKMTVEKQDTLLKKQDEEILVRAPKDRADPKLVQVVEELGSAANGEWAELKVIEIPDGIEWEILSNDGFETVHEKHRWW